MSDALGIPRTSSSIHLLQRIRDEAHRFAITFHRQLRDKRTLTSELEEIQGIGPKSIGILMEKFGSVQGVRGAAMEDVAAVLGEKKARVVRAFFDRPTIEERPEPNSDELITEL
jgi:excinuclease ABC subunit C